MKRRLTTEQKLRKVIRRIIKEELNKPGKFKTLEDAFGGRKPTIEVSLSYAMNAGEAFRDAYSKMGKMTSTNTFQFKNAEDAEEFAEYLMDYIDIPEEEITGHNLDE